MPIVIDDSTNPSASSSSLNLKQVLNSFAFILKQITGQTDWKTAPIVSLTGLAQSQGQPGDKGDTGAQGIQGLKGDTGATGAQGIQGLKGDTGNKGDTGATPDPAPGAWQNLSLSTGWGNYATGYTTAQCRKYTSGLIEVKGILKKSSALVANEIMCTLPVAYRPSEIMMLVTWASGGTSRITIETGGAIRLNSGNAAGVGLNFFFGLIA
jgi:hypothetical protein